MEVSIIIPVYNREKYLARAIRSALAQRFNKEAFEIIVINDGSTDHSMDVALDFGDAIRYIHFEQNRGLPSARNEGIRAARGRYIVNLDSDDYIHQDLLYIENLFLAMNPNWDAVTCDYFHVDQHENHLERICGKTQPIACGIMFRRDLLIDIGLYDETLRMREEQDLMTRFQAKHKVYHIQLPLYRYRRHDSNMTNDIEAVKHYERLVLEKHLQR